jgi:hypothetical protein
MFFLLVLVWTVHASDEKMSLSKEELERNVQDCRAAVGEAELQCVRVSYDAGCVYTADPACLLETKCHQMINVMDVCLLTQSYDSSTQSCGVIRDLACMKRRSEVQPSSWLKSAVAWWNSQIEADKE